MKNDDENHCLVDATVQSKKIYIIPRNKVGKFMVSRTDETKNFQEGPGESSRVISQIFSFLRDHQTNSSSIPCTSNQANVQQSNITTSPQTKRKGSPKTKEDSSSSSSENELGPSKIKKILFS